MTNLPSPDEIEHAVASVDAAVAAGRISAAGAENVKHWLTRPHYRSYSAKLVSLVRDQRFADLETLFWEVVPFGTGGRRGRMAELGSATINARTIAESADGMAVYLKQATGTSGGRAVVAHDTRNRSVEFARITATTLAAHGLKVFLFESHRSTPELSFAVRRLQCDVGVMISASHNPPSDNGFKAYWSTGGQVLPPHDEGIISCVVRAEEIPTVDYEAAVANGSIEIIGSAIDRDYLAALATLPLATLSLSDARDSVARDVRAVYTPLHGVGETSVYRLLQEQGFSQVEIFEPQRRPDGNFTNVPAHLPNPELTSAFGPAVAHAATVGADLVLASDPDADRLGVSVRGRDGRFTHLTGNQVGALLTDYILRKRRAAGTLSPEHFVCTTLVTTPMIGAIGRAHRAMVIDDLLVGFKYIAQTMDERGPQKFVFGVEESLGYLAGSYCRDKDAAIAALYVLELAAELKRQGKTLLDGLDDLYKTHGYFLEGQRSEACQGPRGKEQVDLLLRTLCTKPPRQLAGVPLVRVRDYRAQVVRRIPDNAVSGALSTTKGDLLFLDSAEGATQFSIAVRPSGTEPKIKFYFFARAQLSKTALLEELKAQTASAMHALQEALSQWVHEVLDADASGP